MHVSYRTVSGMHLEAMIIGEIKVSCMGLHHCPPITWRLRLLSAVSHGHASQLYVIEVGINCRTPVPRAWRKWICGRYLLAGHGRLAI